MPNPLRVVTDTDMARRYYELRYRSPHAGSGARQWVDRIFREGVARVFRQRVPISIDIAAGLLPRLCATSWHHLLSVPRRLGLRLGLRLGCSASAMRCFDRRFSALEVHAPAFSCACTLHRVSKIEPRCVATAERAALEWVRSTPPPHGWCQLRQTCPSRWCCRRCQYARQ